MSYPYLIQPRDDQREATRDIYRKKHVLIVGDMGVGKTKIVVDFFATMIHHEKISRILVIAPLEAVDVWSSEIEINAPFVTSSLYIKDSDPDFSANVIIINFDFLSPRRKKRKPTERAIKMAKSRGKKPRVRHFVDKGILNELLKWDPEIVIVDEGHKIKSPTKRRSKAVHQFSNAKYTIDLTGTPTGNRKAMDLWSQFRFIKPDLLDEDFKTHKFRYGIWGGFGNFTLLKPRNLKHLAKKIAPHVIRVKKTGMPPKNFIPIPVTIPPEAKAIYKSMEREFVAYVSGQNVIASIALTKAIKLSQIAGGHIKNEDKENLPIHRAKLDVLNGLLEDFEEQGVKHLVIFARFLWELEEIRKLLVKRGWKYHRVKGRVTKETLDDYNANGGVMLCQTASGSGSNNFQAANYMVFYSTDYSLINFLQAIDRIHRTGQTKPCFYYFLQAKGTIDRRIYNLLQDNKDVSEEIKTLIEEVIDDNRRGA